MLRNIQILFCVIALLGQFGCRSMQGGGGGGPDGGGGGGPRGGGGGRCRECGKNPEESVLNEIDKAQQAQGLPQQQATQPGFDQGAPNIGASFGPGFGQPRIIGQPPAGTSVPGFGDVPPVPDTGIGSASATGPTGGPTATTPEIVGKGSHSGQPDIGIAESGRPVADTSSKQPASKNEGLGDETKADRKTASDEASTAFSGVLDRMRKAASKNPFTGLFDFSKKAEESKGPKIEELP